MHLTKIATTLLGLGLLAVAMPAAAQLPEPDPSVLAGRDPKELLRLSFLGIERANYRAYLAEHRADTIEGQFAQAWVLYSQGKYAEAVEAYTRVVEDPKAWPELKCAAAGNREVSASAGKMDSADKWQDEAIRMSFETGYLESGALKNVSKEKRPFWEEMHRKYPQLIQEKRAAHLLNEARYYNGGKDSTKVRQLVEELLRMGPEKWGSGFEFSYLLTYMASSSVVPNLQPAQRLAQGEMPQRLLDLMARTKKEEKDPVRRAEVASWGLALAKAFYDADRQHARLTGVGGVFVLPRDLSNGAYPLYPSGTALYQLRELWDGARDGNQLSEVNGRFSLPLEAIEDATTNFKASGDSTWHAEHGILLARLGREEEAKRAFQQAAKGCFHWAEYATLLNLYANECAGPMDFNTAGVQRQLETLLDKLPPDGRRSAVANLAALSFRTGDISGARRWLEQFQKEHNISEDYLKERMESLENVEAALREREKFASSNPLETRWQSEHGREGISVQLNFRTNSADLPAETDTKLAPIIRVLGDDSYQNLAFRLEGHTDSTGTDVINNPLSLRRAQSLANYLETRHNVARGRLEIDGFGSRRPIASNLSESGKALNRRVELNLMGDLARPRLVATGAMDNGISAVSPDGRLMVSYSGDVWDTREWVRLYTVNFSWRRGGLTFSPDGRYLAVATRDPRDAKTGFYNFPSVLLLDARTGVLADIIPVHDERLPHYPAWSPDSKKLAFAIGAWCMVYDVEKKAFVGSAQARASRNQPFFPSWIKGGEALAMLAGSGRERLSIINAKNFEVKAISVSDLTYSHAMNSSYDGRYLYITNDDGAVLDWDTLSADAPRLHPAVAKAVAGGKKFAGKRISVHPGKPQTIAVDSMHAPFNWGVIDFATGTVKADSARAQNLVFWGPDAKSLLVTGGWVANDRASAAEVMSGIYQLDLSTDSPVSNDRLELIKGPAARMWGLLALESHNAVVAFSSGNISIWDVTTGRQMHQWADDAAFYLAAPKGQEGVFYAVLEDKEAKKSTLVKYDLNQFRREEITRLGDFDVSSIDAGQKAVLLGGAPFMERGRAMKQLELRLVDATSGKLLKSRSVDALTERLINGEMQASSFVSVRLSPAGDEAAFVTQWADGYIGHGLKKSKQARLWDLKADALREPASRDWTGGIESIHYEADGRLRVARYAYGWDAVYDTRKGDWEKESLPRKTRPNLTCAAALEEAFQFLNLKVEYARRGEIRFLRRDTDATVVTILKKGDEWIASTEEGYFAASSGGTDKVFWRVGSRMLPLATLRDKFENPALLADSLKAIFEKRTVRRTEDVKPIVSPELFNVPYEVRILTPSGAQTKEEKFTVKVEVKALTPDAPEPVFVWSNNGRMDRGFKVVPSKPEPRVHLAEREFALSDGRNELEVALRYKDAVILKQSITVTRSAPAKKATGGVASGTQLWFFGVGVKSYEKPDQNLDYADRDVLEFAKMLQSQQGTLYGQVNVKTLINEQATVRDIKVEMNRFLKQASSQDLVIILLAGHGVQGNDQELYFVAHDSNMDEPFTGLELQDFADFLERRPPTQKAVFLMDCCHAGSFGQTKSKKRGNGLTSDEAVRLIEEGTGTIVFASSTGRESSLEDAKWRGGHGAFTAALLEGLEGRADGSAGESDGYVSVMELASFVSRQVPQMTGNAQHPIMPRSENVRDFPLGRKR